MPITFQRITPYYNMGGWACGLLYNILRTTFLLYIVKKITQIIQLSNAMWSPKLTCGLILNVPARFEHDTETQHYYFCSQVR